MKKHIAIFTAFSAIALSLLFLWKEEIGLFKKDFSEAVFEASELMRDASSFGSDISLKLKTQEGYVINGNFKADMSSQNSGGLSLHSTFAGTVFANEIHLSANGEFKEIGESFYLLFSSFPDIPLLDSFFDELGIDLETMKGEWLRMDSDFFIAQKEAARSLQNILSDPSSYLPASEVENCPGLKEGQRCYPFFLDEKAEESLAAIFSLEDFEGEGIFFMKKNGGSLERMELEATFFSSGRVCSLSAAADFYNLNQPLLIEAPENFKEISIF